MPLSWPTTLPLPTVQSYGIRPGEAILRTEMEAGPARQRKRFTQVPTRIAVRWLMKREQFALFEAWYRWQAKEGGEWFEIPLLGGLGLVTHEARFTRQFDAKLVGGVLWEIASELEIRERPTLSQDELNLALESDLALLFRDTGHFHALIHTNLPGPLSW
ncbi:conserved hypothetical protein [Rhodospirillaceae bacterium LM-1]|nr:conserved hypothetical protein [Rhodospirillaceae bacterium LM-1]